MKRYENLEKKMCHELDKLDRKYSADGAELAAQDLEMIDLLYHSLKSAETYYAMVDPEGWEDKDVSGRSYRRGRDAMGRYASRDMEMDPEMSGRWYPPMYPMSYGRGYRY